MRFLAVFLALIIVACSAASGEARKHKRPAPNPTYPGWYFQYGEPNPVINADGVSSVWTASPRVEPHYWLKNWKTPFLKSQTISITYKIEPISGTPVVYSTECPSTWKGPGLAALMIRHSTNNADYYNRAWFITRGKMTMGTHTITAPIGDGTGWSFVTGGATGDPRNYPNKWDYILANPIDIALTFNGCSSMGHGVFVEGGSLKITIVAVTVQ